MLQQWVDYETGEVCIALSRQSSGHLTFSCAVLCPILCLLPCKPAPERRAGAPNAPCLAQKEPVWGLAHVGTKWLTKWLTTWLTTCSVWSCRRSVHQAQLGLHPAPRPRQTSQARKADGGRFRTGLGARNGAASGRAAGSGGLSDSGVAAACCERGHAGEGGCRGGAKRASWASRRGSSLDKCFSPCPWTFNFQFLNVPMNLNTERTRLRVPKRCGHGAGGLGWGAHTEREREREMERASSTTLTDCYSYALRHARHKEAHKRKRESTSVFAAMLAWPKYPRA